MSTYRLKNLLSPHSVALVGASPRQGSVGRAILGNIHKTKFKGDFGLVNTHYPEIDGVVTVDSLGKLLFVPELVVITAPAAAVVGLIDEAGKQGTVGALIVSAGLGHDAGSLADAAERAAQKYGMRLIAKLSRHHDAQRGPQRKFRRPYAIGGKSGADFSVGGVRGSDRAAEHAHQEWPRTFYPAHRRHAKDFGCTCA